MKALVALESTVFVHGLPDPVGVDVALKMADVVRATGAEPRTIGVVAGRIVADLSADQIRHLGGSSAVAKVSRRDLPVVVARRLDGATTVATTMWVAYHHGIPVVATGGIGGVHRGSGAPGTGSFDVSADLEELAQTPVTVVCSGPKAVLDLEATRQALETRGITVVGYGTDEMPAFYTPSSGLPVDVRCDTAEEVAAIVKARHQLGLPGAVLVTVPVPEASAIGRDDVERAVALAHQAAQAAAVHGAAVTPFLLAEVGRILGPRAVDANAALLVNNARVAAGVARALIPKPLVA